MSQELLHPVPLDRATRENCLKLVELALVEDVGSADLDQARDCTTLSVVPDDIHASATFVSRDDGILCGLQVIQLAIDEFAPGLQLDCRVMDSQPIQRDQALAVLSGNARQILMMERTCLNFMCRLSGISTRTRQFVQRIAETNAMILDTRKTLPGWRRLEKYAVACGGGANHRMGLYDAIMIKDNHLAMYGSHIDNHKQSIADAIRLARQWIEKNKNDLPNGKNTIVQIEVETLDQLNIALESEPDIILLDNMDIHRLSRAVQLRDATKPHVLLEASGGVNLENVFEIAKTGIERISVGAITHSAVNLDIGLDWQIGSPIGS